MRIGIETGNVTGVDVSIRSVWAQVKAQYRHNTAPVQVRYRYRYRGGGIVSEHCGCYDE